MARPRKNEEETQEQVEETPAAEPEAEAEPAAEEAPAEEPAAEETPAADEAPADEPAEEPAPEPVAEEEPAAEAEAPAEEPSAEEPAPEEQPEAEAEPAAEAEEPAAEAEEASAAAEAPAAPIEPKKKRKRVPRADRRQRPKPTREEPAERKPIVRLPKPEHVRGGRKERRGVVISAAMDKTIVVRVDTVKPHPVYKKIVRRSTRLHAHDESNVAKTGDLVRVVETRPLSKTKFWRLAEVLEEAK
jgi:small subunit ribosomal protein S17